MEQIRRMLQPQSSIFRELYHFSAFRLRRLDTLLEKAALIISIDIDVGCKGLGLVNKGLFDEFVHTHLSEYEVGEIEERSLPLFNDVFDSIEVPVTFALRGQVVELDGCFPELLLKSSVKHDIGAHGYSHKTYQTLSYREAENELNMISLGMKKYNIAPKSFVFPKNIVFHLELLEKFGYKCYRGHGNLLNDDMRIEKKGELFNVHPSLYLCKSLSPMFLKRILDVAVTKKTPFHVWFHLWSFGQTNESIKKYINVVFLPFLKYAKTKEKSGMLTFETMLSAANKLNKLLNAVN